MKPHLYASLSEPRRKRRRQSVTDIQDNISPTDIWDKITAGIVGLTLGGSLFLWIMGA